MKNRSARLSVQTAEHVSCMYMQERGSKAERLTVNFLPILRLEITHN